LPPLEYAVREGDTCSGIALRFGIPIAVLIAANNLDPGSCLIRVGQRLVIPLPTPTPDPNAAQPANFSPSADRPAQIVYTVRSGDTCSELAQKLKVPINVLIAQNNLDANCSIRVGQVLTITFATPTPVPSPTPIVAQTPTPRASYDAPIVIAPAAGAQISEAQRVVTLQWLTVGLLGPEEWYVVQVQPTGAVTVPIFETKATSLKLTQDILGERTEGEIVWWVQVKRLMGVDPLTGQRIYAELSPPSVARSFIWRRPLPGTPISPGNGAR
jgi:LysM repeat protein